MVGRVASCRRRTGRPSLVAVVQLTELRLPNGVAMLVGQATVPSDAVPVMDSEHDEFAWWPPDPQDWPEEAEFLKEPGSSI